MSGVFDRLQNKMPPADDGRKLAAMGNLPPGQRKLMRMLLREGDAMKYTAICEAVDEMPEADRMSRDQLDAELADLASEGWVIRMGEGDNVAYEANLGFKPPSTLSHAIWSTLGSKIQQSKSTHEAPPDESA